MANTKKRKQPSSQSIFQAVSTLLTDEKTESVHVRFMSGSDMKQVENIERECFGSEAWSEHDLVRNLTRRLCVAMVAVRKDRVVGYMAYRLNRSHLELVRIAVAASSRRSKVGSGLLDHLKKKLESKNLKKLLVDVPDMCLPIQLLLRSNGFRAVEILKSRSEEYYRMIYKKPTESTPSL